MHRLFSVMLAAIALVYWAYFGEPARAQPRTAQEQLAVDIYKELVEINTVTETGDTARAAEAMAARLRTAGFSEADVQVFTPASRKGIWWRGCAGRVRASRSYCSLIPTV